MEGNRVRPRMNIISAFRLLRRPGVGHRAMSYRGICSGQFKVTNPLIICPVGRFIG